MRYLSGILIALSVLSCNKENATNNASILIRVGSKSDLLTNAIVIITTDSVRSAELSVQMSAPCGGDDAAYFKNLGPGWYCIHASGYSVSRGASVSGDTLFLISYSAGRNHYKIDLPMD